MSGIKITLNAEEALAFSSKIAGKPTATKSNNITRAMTAYRNAMNAKSGVVEISLSAGKIILFEVIGKAEKMNKKSFEEYVLRQLFLFEKLTAKTFTFFVSTEVKAVVHKTVSKKYWRKASIA